MRFAVVAATFYRDLADRLITSAQQQLEQSGATAVDLFELPGAFELPMAAKMAADSGLYDGIICLGVVIRGETDHYDFVCGEAARGIQEVQLESGVPCGFGLLTVDNYDQAIARSGGDKRDSAHHAVDAVLSLIAVKSRLTQLA